MPSYRFYTPHLQDSIHLKEEEHHHLSRVMRVGEGEMVELIDGKGSLAQARVVKIQKSETHLTLETVEHFPAPLLQIHLAIPLMRPSKLEWIIEKGTELGADHFLFYLADRSEKTGNIVQHLDRMRTITIAATKQSGRLYLPGFDIVDSLQDALKTEMTILYGDTDPQAPWIEPSKEPTLFVSGPEAGFSDAEKAFLKERTKGIKLSENILRAETAPIVALTILKLSS